MEINELLEGLFADVEKKKIGRIVGEKKSDGTYEIVDKEGRVIQRAFRPSERYVVDFADNRTQEGWMQFDTGQDAPYYGVWVNPTKLQTLSYAEGDWALVTCESEEWYNAELLDMCEFHDEGRIATGIDTKTGQVTIYRQDRTKFFIIEEN